MPASLTQVWHHLFHQGGGTPVSRTVLKRGSYFFRTLYMASPLPFVVAPITRLLVEISRNLRKMRPDERYLRRAPFTRVWPQGLQSMACGVGVDSGHLQEGLQLQALFKTRSRLVRAWRSPPTALFGC